MFKMQGLELELISYCEMCKMIHPNICSCICHASGRYRRANNQYMNAHYRFDEPSSFILSIDATKFTDGKYPWQNCLVTLSG